MKCHIVFVEIFSESLNIKNINHRSMNFKIGCTSVIWILLPPSRIKFQWHHFGKLTKDMLWHLGSLIRMCMRFRDTASQILVCILYVMRLFVMQWSVSLFQQLILWQPAHLSSLIMGIEQRQQLSPAWLPRNGDVGDVGYASGFRDVVRLSEITW